MKRNIMLVRHFQTELAEKKRLIGQCDVSLSLKGIEGAKKLGIYLQKDDFSHVICSSLKRTKQTADILSSYLSVLPQPYKELNEISLGKWDGMYVDDIIKEYPKEYIERGNDLLNFRISGGENFIDLSKRIKKIFEEILNKSGNIIIVGHSSVNKVILCHILNIPLNNLFKLCQDYGCCSLIVQRDLDFHVKFMNSNIYNFYS